jgi:hypothetical protein
LSSNRRVVYRIRSILLSQKSRTTSAQKFGLRGIELHRGFSIRWHAA